MHLTPGYQVSVSGAFYAPVPLTPKYTAETEARAEVAFGIDVDPPSNFGHETLTGITSQLCVNLRAASE
jgi:hypothetical protein